MSQTISEGLTDLNITFLMNDIDLSGTLDLAATVDEGVTETQMSADVILENSISIDVVKDIFQFQTDASSIDDISSSDILYKQLFSSNNDALLGAIVSSKTKTGTGGYLTEQLMSQDYVQHIAKNVFGTYLGADILDNEQELRDELIGDFSNSFNQYFLDNSSNLYNISSEEIDQITRKLMQTIMRLDGSRLDASNSDITFATEEFQPLPFKVGDVLVMKYNQFDNNHHCVDLSNNSWDAGQIATPTRTYLIKLTIE